MSKGVIYILTNPSFPEYVKIGFATDLNERIRQLNSSAAVPYSFHAFASYDVSEKLTDCRLHALIDKLDPELRSIEKFDGKTRKREFYKMSAEDAYDLLECIATISGTTKRLHRVQANEQRQAEEKEAREDRDSARRGPFKFSDCGIRPGARVYFKRDTSKFAVVVDDRHVRYGEEVTSLSALAKEWLKLSTAVQGPRYFTYKGELLDDLRNRLSK
jgi:hypothetical protein